MKLVDDGGAIRIEFGVVEMSMSIIVRYHDTTTILFWGDKSSRSLTQDRIAIR